MHPQPRGTPNGPRRRRRWGSLLPIVAIAVAVALLLLRSFNAAPPQTQRSRAAGRAARTPAAQKPVRASAGASSVSDVHAEVNFADADQARRAPLPTIQQLINGHWLSSAVPPARAEDEWRWFVSQDTYMPYAGARHPSFGQGPPMPWPLPVNPNLFTEEQRRVVDMVRYAWSNYKALAWGHDELLPGKKKFRDWGGGEGTAAAGPHTDNDNHLDETVHSGIAVTLIESLDTLYLCGLAAEFAEAVDHVRHDVSFDVDVTVNFFETTIRVLGGLLSAYELSGEAALLDKAHDLGKRLISAYEVDSNCEIGDACRRRRVVPTASVNLKHRTGVHPKELGDTAWLSEVASVQLEFRKLAFYTGYAVYDFYPQRTMLELLAFMDDREAALYPLKIERGSARPIDNSGISLGARGDSFVEYLAKQAALDDWRDVLYPHAWAAAVGGIMDRLTVQSNATHSFVVESTFDEFRQVFTREYRMDHLVCFLPGALRVGAPAASVVYGKERGAIVAHTLEQRHQDLARAIERTCVGMYDTSPSGLAPEIFKFRRDTLEPYADPSAKGYHLRPETLESLFYATQLEPDAARRARARAEAARIVGSIEASCRIAGGYAGVSDTTRAGSSSLDVMETFFLAETLKYAFLAQHASSNAAALPLTDWVFNTEGHPLRKLRASMSYPVQPNGARGTGPPVPTGGGTTGHEGAPADDDAVDVLREELAEETRAKENARRNRRGLPPLVDAAGHTPEMVARAP